MSAPSFFARPMSAMILSRLPARSPTVGFIWAMAMRSLLIRCVPLPRSVGSRLAHFVGFDGHGHALDVLAVREDVLLELLELPQPYCNTLLGGVVHPFPVLFLLPLGLVPDADR